MFVFAGKVAGKRPEEPQTDPLHDGDEDLPRRMEEFSRKEEELMQELARVRSQIRTEVANHGRRRFGVGRFLDDHLRRKFPMKGGDNAAGGRSLQQGFLGPRGLLPMLNSEGGGILEPRREGKVTSKGRRKGRGGTQSEEVTENDSDSDGSHRSKTGKDSSGSADEEGSEHRKDIAFPVLARPSINDEAAPSIPADTDVPGRQRRRSSIMGIEVNAAEAKELSEALGLSKNDLVEMDDDLYTANLKKPPFNLAKKTQEGGTRSEGDRVFRRRRRKNRRNLRTTLPSLSKTSERSNQVVLAYSSFEASSKQGSSLVRRGRFAPSLRATASAPDGSLFGTTTSPLGGSRTRPDFSPLRLGKRQAWATQSRKMEQDLTRQALRKELTTSLANVEDLTSKVKSQMEAAASLIPPSKLRARAYARKWGRKKLLALLTRLTQGQLVSAWAAWRHHVWQKSMSEKRAAVQRFRCIRTLEKRVEEYQQSSVSGAFEKWVAVSSHLRALEIQRRRYNAAVRVQTQMRVFLAKKEAVRIRRRVQREKEDRAARKIQGLFLMHNAKTRGKELLKRLKDGVSATEIQRIVRGRIGRRIAAARRRFIIATEAATEIQRVVRGFLARHGVWWKRNMEIATKGILTIQRVYRGHLARARVRRIRVEAAQLLVARKLQGWFRGRLARAITAAKRKEREEARKFLFDKATAISRIYRGHSTRMRWALRLERHRIQVRKEKAAAIMLQRVYRGHRVRRERAARERTEMDKLMALARKWDEVYNEEAQGMYYVNEATGESAWKPPTTGYRKVTGQLVLSNGRCVDDPQSGKKPHCVECEDRLATVWCITCDDPYCSSCYQRIHRKGKKAKHKSIEISEDGAWVHDRYETQLEQARGQGAAHAAEEQHQHQRYGYGGGGAGGADREWAQEAFGMYAGAEGYDPNMQGQGYYGGGEGTDAQGGGYGDGSGYGQGGYGDASGYGVGAEAYLAGSEFQSSVFSDGVGGYAQEGDAGGSEWVQQVDEQGQSYYYNTITGESQWA